MNALKPALVRLALLLVVIGCGWSNPVTPEYPCGSRGLVCDTDPLACCWNHQYCGRHGTRCPEGMCCFDGDGASADSSQAPPNEITKQWRP